MNYSSLIKIKAWPKLLIPCLVGQILSFCLISLTQDFLYLPMIIGLILVFLNLYYILFMNDYADIKVDLIKKKIKDKDPYTIAIDLLSKQKILYIGLAFGFSYLLLSFLVQMILLYDYFLVLSIISILLILLYSFEPFKLNYKGGGEVLEALGVGVLVPWTNAYLQSYQIFHKVYFFFIYFFSLSLCSAICSGFKDYESDIKGGKKTFVILFGYKKTLEAMRFLFFFSICCLNIFMYVYNFPFYFSMLNIVFFLFMFRRYRTVENDFCLQKISSLNRYKDFFHIIIKSHYFFVIMCFFIYKVFLHG